MGSRGAASGTAKNGKKYGTEYRSFLQYGRIKFVKESNSKTTKAPMETMTRGRIYATVNKQGKLKSLDLYGKNGRRLAHIGVNGAPHKINGEAVLPHIHMGYFHTEYGGSRKLNDYESGLVAKAQRALYNYRRG
ncbi:MAG TPA: hypothetical protein H9958_03130 [Candidatus Limosilactobacillus intestinavium]|nr:hypothetical protein [Candidatus Limosilactobacillus intestinavium]